MNRRASLRGSRPKATPDGSLRVHTRDDDNDDDDDDYDNDAPACIFHYDTHLRRCVS